MQQQNSVSEQIDNIHEFLQSHYYAQLHDAMNQGLLHLTIDFRDLSKYNISIAQELLEEPEEVFRQFQLALKQFDFDINADDYRFRFKNLPKSEKGVIRDLRSEDLNKLIYLEGVVRQKSDVRPRAISAKFECPKCANAIELAQNDEKLQAPAQCTAQGCSYKGKFRLLDTKLVDCQGMVLEEMTTELEGGQQPKRLKILLKEDLVSPMTDSKTNPGTNVQITGTLTKIERSGKDGGKLTSYDYLFMGNYIASLSDDHTDMKISRADEERIKQIAHDPNVVQNLVLATAPGIYGHEIVKEAIIMQFLGGVQKARKDGVKNRGDMHILLIGDPGSGKSQLLKRASVFAPKGRYVSGKGASGAGLTASVVKDEFMGGWALEAGALVLANKGICLSADTEILLANGTTQTIAQIYTEMQKQPTTSVSVASFSQETLKTTTNAIIGVSKRLAKDVFELEFARGQKISITTEHPLPVWDNGVIWKQVADIKTGEYILDFTEIAYEAQETISIELAQILGLLVTDGHLAKTKYKVALYTKNEEIAQTYTKLCERVFHKTPTMYVDTRRNVRQLYFYDKQIHSKLQELGIPNGSKTYSGIDLTQMQSQPKRIIRAFLAQVINGDGCISNRKGGGIVSIVSANMQFCKQLVLLFMKVGVRAKIITKTQSGGGVVLKGSYQIYSVEITGVSNIANISSTHLLAYKKEKLELILAREDKSAKIFRVEKLLRGINEKLTHTQKKMLYKNSIKLSTLQNSGVSIQNITKLLTELKKNNIETPESKILHSFVSANLRCNKLISKTPVRNQYVYNISVAKTHTYFANLLPVHNCLIDELDKMTPEDRSAMHEALEQQSVTISKANIQATLRCETTVLAAANPKMGRFDPFEPLAKQIDLPPALISRFDLIFPFRDIPNTETDEKLADFILNMHQKSTNEEPEIDTDTLRKYLIYARRNCHPKITDSAKQEMQNYYVKMRNDSMSSDGGMSAIPITARQLEALVRMAEASAKMRLSAKATKRDAKRAIEILDFCLSQIGVDPDTGRVDIDRLTTGVTTSQRNKVINVREIIKELEEKHPDKQIPVEEIYDLASQKGMKQDKVEDALQKLKLNGDIYEPKRNFISRIV